MYVGYSDQNGMADWYLEGYCPKKANHTFLVRTTLFTETGIVDQNLASTTTPDIGVVRTTSLYCEPQYFVQQVNASVAAANGSGGDDVGEAGGGRAMRQSLGLTGLNMLMHELRHASRLSREDLEFKRVSTPSFDDDIVRLMARHGV